MFTVYYFEGPGYEIFPLRTRFNDIFHQWGGGRYWLGNILHALRGPQDIWHDGYVRGDIRPADCHQLRNGKWAMRVEVTDGDCRGLWDLMIRKWVPHCRYYYLVYGENGADAETNVDLVSSKLIGPAIRLDFETRVRIYRIHYLVRDGQKYFMPALEALRKEGRIH